MIGIISGILAGIFQLIGYFLYSKDVFKGQIKPNTASWSIWTVGSVLESYSYIALTGDWVKNILPIVCSLSVIAFFFICIKRGHFEKISPFEWIIVIGDTIAIFVWWLYQSAFYANTLLIVTAIASFLPIIRHTYLHPKEETPGPWIYWTIAYFLLGVTSLLRFEKVEDLLYPISFLILHAIVAILAQRGKLKKASV